MKKISLAIGAAALLSLGAIATRAQAGERVQTQVLIQAPLLLTHYDNGARPTPGVRVVPGYYQAQNDFRRHDGYRDGGRWDQRHRRGDRDHDGVRNRYDRDRDGDGVPNRYDRRPDNPYRY